MTDAIAACWDAPSFNVGIGLRRDQLRFFRLAGSAFVGLGTAGFVCLPLVAVATAGWLMAASHGGKPRFDLRASPVPARIAAIEPHVRLAARMPESGVTTVAKTMPGRPPDVVVGPHASFESRWASAFGPVVVRHTVASVGYDKLPDAKPEMKPEITHGPAAVPAQVASAVPPPVPAPPALEKSAPVKEAHNRTIVLPGRESRTAVYDISARTVYMPNGERLEAHSGLGEKMDNPRYVRVRMRGPTPPNVYELTLRQQIFHGVRAIRLNPVDENRMFGRDGMLAHTYMLGPNGQSNGCVSFRDYSRFLRAYLNGEVTRLVVVPHLGDMPLGLARAGGAADTNTDNRYASADPPEPVRPLTW